MKKVAVILSGCGVMDGAEIHESVLTLLHLQKAGVVAQCVAPNIPVAEVMNHLTQKPSDETRNVLIESARIARGQVQNLEEVSAADFDAAILPGGFGAAKNLCNFALKGNDFELHPSLTVFLQGFIEAKKPVGFICIAPVMIAKLYPAGVKMTIGQDEALANQLTALGVTHQKCNVDEISVDTHHKVVSTPAYMLAKNLVEAEKGISRLVEQVIKMI